MSQPRSSSKTSSNVPRSSSKTGSSVPRLLGNANLPKMPGEFCSTANVAACQAAAAHCEARFRDLEIPSCDAVRPERYQAAGTESWDPFGALPGFEAVDRRPRARAEEEKPDEFKEIVKMLDLKRCPKCMKDWSAKDPYDTLTPLLKEDSAETRYSAFDMHIVYHQGKRYNAPFGELILKAISLCPHCHGKGTAHEQASGSAGGKAERIPRASSKGSTVRKV
mmetsp:Transcript_56546/g.165365  ORF Transcript_56546/g.165365 Transcript_56546/m.165365 type:complete len:222 (-) Transcript_56546:58-723(-)